MCRAVKYFAVCLAAAALLLPATAAAAEKKKKKPSTKEKVAAFFKVDGPRWQASMMSNFVTFIDYDNYKRDGRGASAFGLFRISRALGLSLEVGYFIFERAYEIPEDVEDYVELEATQLFTIKALLRYDLDIIDIHPWVAAGVAVYFFAAGNLEDIDPVHWGPNVEVGLDYALGGRFLLGFVYGWGWIMKYAPPEGNDYPSMTQIAIKMGGVF